MILTVTKFVAKQCAFREIIRKDGDRYLTRYKILGFMPNKPSWLPISLYLHQFHRPDADDAPHNHPWKWSFSFVLVGGYEEYRETFNSKTGKIISQIQTIKPGHFNWISHSCYHLIKKLRGKETWTLFIAGPRISSWGFLDPIRGHIEWRQYLTEQGIQLPY